MKKFILLFLNLFITSSLFSAAQKPPQVQKPQEDERDDAAFVLANLANLLMNCSTIVIHTSHAHNEGHSPDPHVVAPAAANAIGSFFNIIADMVSKKITIDRRQITAQDIEEYFLAQDPEFITKLEKLFMSSGQTIVTTSYI